MSVISLAEAQDNVHPRNPCPILKYKLEISLSLQIIGSPSGETGL